MNLQINNALNLIVFRLLCLIFLLIICLTSCQGYEENSVLLHDPEIPKFPFPPPQFSAKAEVPLNADFIADRNGKIKLHDIDNLIKKALEVGGYHERGYFSVPDGFAVVTELEYISSDGTANHEQRWPSVVGPNDTVGELANSDSTIRKENLDFILNGDFDIKTISSDNTYRLRLFAFLITPHSFNQGDAFPSQSEVRAWRREGLNRLPDRIGEMDFANHSITALVYEYEYQNGKVKAISNSSVQGRTHLEKANIYKIIISNPI